MTKPSSENQDSESDHNYVNATTELNHNEYIKPSANVIEAIYFNIFECGRNVLDKLDVTYQSAFAASEKPAPSTPLVKWDTQEPSTTPATYTSTLTTPLKKMISKLTGSKP